jgi:hypothetical protein
LLLPIALNQEAQRLPFDSIDAAADTKKKIYSRHNLRMVKEVCENKDWTIIQITTRELQIVEWAKTRWSDL